MNSNATNGRGGRRGGGRGGRGRGGSGGRGGRGGGRGGRGGRGGGGRGGQHSRNRDDNAKDDHSHEFDEGDNNNNNANNNNANASNNNNNNTTNNNTSNGNRNNNNRRNNKKKQSGRQQQQQQQQNEPVFQDGSTETTTASAKQQDKDEKKKPAQRRRRRRNNNNNNNNNNNSSRNNSNTYCEYWAYKECLEKYFNEDPNLIRGRLRVMPGGPKKAKSNNNNENNNDNQTRDNNEATTKAFCACDRGTLQRDVIIQSEIDCNRALNGDTVYIKLYPLDDDDEEDEDYDDYSNTAIAANTPNSNNAKMPVQPNHTNHQASSSATTTTTTTTTTTATWQDDPMQMKLWNPAVPIPKKDPNRPLATKDAKSGASTNGNNNGENDEENNNDEVAMKQVQRRGRVVYVEPPKSILTAHQPSEIHPSGNNKGKENNKNKNNNNVKPRRLIVGTLRTLQSGTCLLTPTNRSLPQFVCNQLPQYFLENEVFEEEEILSKQQEEKQEKEEINHKNSNHNKNKRTNNIKIKRFLYQAEYVYYSWKVHHQWPPCINLKRIGQSFSVEDEIKTLLLASDVDHGEFPPRALQDVEQSVQSGLFVPSEKKNEDSTNDEKVNTNDAEDDMMGWKPTKDMYVGRRDLRHERIFTIDPTTAKDLDDALHIKKISKNRVEVGVHIADVSHFVKPNTAIDVEAQRRATTVYLVDRTVPMLPRPLCEIACSLNENVERLAFSCIWTMNLDGTMGGDDDNNNNIWFGRTVIKSCARLDYATAQNIIDEKVTHGEKEDEIDESFWPTSRRPIPGNEYGHTCYDVAKDVRLMFQVAMGRRRLRFQNGALALHGIKLTFQLDPMDHEKKPLLCQPYPIRDSNRLVEEFMLLANYLVAQRMVTHSGPLGVLRYHPPPIPDGLDKVADIAYNAMGFKMDVSTSESLHESLCQMERICNSSENTNGVDGKLVLQCITQMVMTPMQAAEYFVVGKVPHAELWSHFALNIPYYTHFTSPIRRYPDIMVHRLLQDTIDAENNGTNNDSNKKKANKNENNGDNNDEDDDEDPQKAIIEEYSKLCDHCNEKRMASKEAQERCDRVFLSLYVHHNPMRNILGIVLSVGKKTFTIFVPSIGIDSLVYMDEHKDVYDFETLGDPENGEQRRIMISKKQQSSTIAEENQQGNNSSWTSLEVKVFTKLQISCLCKDEPPIDVKVKVEGPWTEDE